MAALENFLSGIGSIITGLINSIFALVEGTFQIVQEIALGIITLIISIVRGFISLGYNLLHFVLSNLPILLFLGGLFFVYSTYIGPQRTQARHVGARRA